MLLAGALTLVTLLVLRRVLRATSYTVCSTDNNVKYTFKRRIHAAQFCREMNAAQTSGFWSIKQ